MTLWGHVRFGSEETMPSPPSAYSLRRRPFLLCRPPNENRRSRSGGGRGYATAARLPAVRLPVQSRTWPRKPTMKSRRGPRRIRQLEDPKPPRCQKAGQVVPASARSAECRSAGRGRKRRCRSRSARDGGRACRHCQVRTERRLQRGRNEALGYWIASRRAGDVKPRAAKGRIKPYFCTDEAGVKALLVAIGTRKEPRCSEVRNSPSKGTQQGHAWSSVRTIKERFGDLLLWMWS